MIAALKQRSILPRFTIIGEPTNCQLQTRANGCYEYKVEIFGKACHSSRPKEGISAINIMARLISFIEETQEKYPDLTSNCGVISGGEVVNKVPSYASLTFDIRSSNLSSVDCFLNEIKLKLSALENEYQGATSRITSLLAIPPLQDLKSEALAAAAKELDITTDEFSGGCEAGYYQAYSGDAVLFGVGDLSLAHKPNEYVVTAEYEKYSKLFKQLLNFMEVRL